MKLSAPSSSASRLSNENSGRPPSTNVDEHPSIGADYGDIVPSVKSPWKAMSSALARIDPLLLSKTDPDMAVRPRMSQAYTYAHAAIRDILQEG